MRTFSKPEVLGLLQHLLAAVGRHHHEMGRELDLGQREDALAGLDAVKPGHLPVDEGDLVALVELGRLAHHGESLLAGGRLVGDEGHVGQHVGEHGARMRIVVDDEHAPAAQVRLEQARAQRRRPLAEPRGEAERASLAGLALDGDAAAHQLGQLLGDGKAEPGAAIFARGRGVGLLEGLE